jgi:hypothetical protein
MNATIINSKSDLRRWVEERMDAYTSQADIDTVTDVILDGSPDYGTDWSQWLAETPDNLMDIVDAQKAKQ